MSDDTSVQVIGSADQFVIRSPAVFHELTPKFKWEFTRRHPYYLMFWQYARRDFQSTTSKQAVFQKIAAPTLQLINVYGEPVDPATPFEDLTGGGEDFILGWHLGAAGPATFKGLLSVLAHHLSPEARQEASLLLANLNTATEPLTVAADLALSRLRHPDFDSFPTDVPILTFNLHAPGRSTNQAVKEFLGRWRKRAGVDEGRRHIAKFATYLEVWDLREGWKGDRYLAGSEQTIQDIAKSKRTLRTTVSNQYQAAYRYIVGHDYRKELWLRLFAWPKLMDVLPISPSLLSRVVANLGVRRQSVATVPETTLMGRSADFNSNSIGDRGAVRDDTERADFIMDVRALRSSGRPTAEIAAALEIDEEQLSQAYRLIDDMDADAL